MKKVIKSKDFIIGCLGNGLSPIGVVNKYIISVKDKLDLKTLELHYNEPPTTIKDFLDDKNLSTQELVEWLNKNYV